MRIEWTPMRNGSWRTKKQRREINDKMTALGQGALRRGLQGCVCPLRRGRERQDRRGRVEGTSSDAGIGSGLTRWAWAKGIMEARWTPVATAPSRGPSSRPCSGMTSPEPVPSDRDHQRPVISTRQPIKDAADVGGQQCSEEAPHRGERVPEHEVGDNSRDHD